MHYELCTINKNYGQKRKTTSATSCLCWKKEGADLPLHGHRWNKPATGSNPISVYLGHSPRCDCWRQQSHCPLWLDGCGIRRGIYHSVLLWTYVFTPCGFPHRCQYAKDSYAPYYEPSNRLP